MKRIIILAALFGLFSPGYRYAGERMEIVSLRTEYAKVFDNGDGTCTAEIANHHIHKKNMLGNWVAFGGDRRNRRITEPPVLFSTYGVFTTKSGGERYESFESPYYSAVGWEAAISGPVAKPVATREWKSCFFFPFGGYLRGLPVEKIVDVYYEIHHPVIRSKGTINVILCRTKPREVLPQFLFWKCSSDVMTSICVDLQTTSMRVKLDTAMADIGPLDECITFGHTSNDLVSVFPSTLGIHATLYLTLSLSESDATMVKTSSSVNVYPNPFNPSTTISFTLAKPGKSTIEVYNAAGQKVETILNANLNAGSHSVTWNATKFSAGVYFYTVRAGGQTKTGKMTLLK